jgi:putative OPT family oligopeptide transporter
MPHEGMDASQSLPAPTAALMAAITEAVFRNSLPWDMMFIGSAVILLALFINRVFNLKRILNLSILGLAIGMYLPLASSIPLFIGGMISLLVQKKLAEKSLSKEENVTRKQKGTLIACGLVAGSALMDVLLAIPFSLLHSPDVLQLVDASWDNIGVYFGVLSTVALGWWIKYRVIDSKL